MPVTNSSSARIVAGAYHANPPHGAPVASSANAHQIVASKK
jgi:hypothetical protein